jgi:hypothetical protein
MPSDPSQLLHNELFGRLNVSADWACDQSGIHWFHDVKLVGPQATPSEEDLRFLFLRFWCHFLVDRIPDPGLVETCESLKEFYDYYKSDAPTLPLVELREHTAQMGESFVRPAFAVEEE